MSINTKTNQKMFANFEESSGFTSITLTDDGLGSLYIPESLQDQLMHTYAFHKKEFVNKVVGLSRSGDSGAVSLLAMLFYNGVLNRGRDRLMNAKALAGIGDSANVPYAAFILGCISLEQSRDREAFVHFEKAGSREFAPALWMQGVLYDCGRGTAEDVSKAADCFLASAKNGYVFGFQEYARIARSGRLGAARRVLALILWPMYFPIHRLRVRFSSLVHASHLVPLPLARFMRE